jgi:hypothetical protein
MKYLKGMNFLNENLTSLDLKEVQDLTILSLSYLIDDNLEVFVDLEDGVISISIGVKDGSILEWDNIKDNIIPLFNLLNNQYILQETTSFFDEDGDHGGFTTDEIINDKVTIKGVEGILIFIRGKK